MIKKQLPQTNSNLNIFQKIGNRIEERKKQQEMFKEKYWELSEKKRLDYNIQREIISSSRYFFGYLTKKLIKGFFYLAGFFFVLYLFSLEQLILSAGFKVLILFLPLFLISIGIDFIIFNVSIVVQENNIKELNKRFKLI
ncbi:MAG TPA: hypothetical protein VMV95_00215 [Bacillota bacterium]|nr:hypothetical protein [Bacillota bacterium]